METITVKFALGGVEAEALKRMAYQELRTPREQVRWVLRAELERRGLIRGVSTETELQAGGEVIDGAG